MATPVALAAPPETRNSRMLGTGSFRPARIVSNEEVAGPIDSSDEWIVTRSGIRSRRFASDTETLGMMAEHAGRAALADAGLDAVQVDAVLVATITHRTATPSLAAEVAARLGTRSPAAVDLGAACSGFCYATAIASDMIRGGSADHVLVIGAERMSDLLDPTDRSTAFVFGDGAGATVIGPCDEPGIGPVAWGSDGTQRDLIRMTELWPRAGRELSGPAPSLTMEGPSVYRWAISQMRDVALLAVKQAGVALADIDVFIPHQANQRIVDTLARNLAFREDVVVARDVAETGNTSGASIPLALDRLRSGGLAKGGDLALLIGFGAGLSYAAQVVRLP
jgi:3-oxoacyl-(acyl-carrier-protein) synthase III